jgi:hypothetical protein
MNLILDCITPVWSPFSIKLKPYFLDPPTKKQKTKKKKKKKKNGTIQNTDVGLKHFPI